MAKRITFEGELQLGHLSMLAAASARELYVEELHRLAEKDERIVFGRRRLRVRRCGE